jgi:protein required for attachment to host cells
VGWNLKRKEQAMLIPTGSIILVTDGARLRVYRNEGTAAVARLVQQDGLEVHVPSSAEMGDDRPGRSFSSHGVGRSSHETANPHDAIEAQFAEDAAERVNGLVAAGETVLLAAAPRTLGLMRKALAPRVRDRLLAEIDADYTKATPEDLSQLLARREQPA